MGESKSSQRRLIGRERELQALEYRKAGMTYAKIGAALGITEQGAYKAVMRALDKLNAKIIEDAAPVRRLECERLDRMLEAVWGSVIQGDSVAANLALKIMERRAKLAGLDMPVKEDIDHAITIRIVDQTEEPSE